MPKRKFFTDPIAMFRFIGDVVKLADVVVEAFDDGKLDMKEITKIGEAFADLVVVHRIAP